MMVDESLKDTTDALAALAAGCTDAINLKVVRVGGLTKAARIRDLAQAAGWMVLVDEPQGADIATAGLAHLAATVEPSHLLGVAYFMGPDMKISYQPQGADTGPRLRDGTVTYTDEPGLGLTIDDAVLGAPLFTLQPRLRPRSVQPVLTGRQAASPGIAASPSRAAAAASRPDVVATSMLPSSPK